VATTAIQNKVEEILDKVAVALVQSTCYGLSATIQSNQKTVRDGIIALGRLNGERLIVYQKDIKANPADLIVGIGETADDAATTDVNESEWSSLESIANTILEFEFIILVDSVDCSINLITIPANSVYGGDYGGLDITNLLQGIDEATGQVNPINLGQFLGFDNKSENIDVAQANEFLDTNIFELLGAAGSRQTRIDAFFTEFSNLTQSPPTFVDDDFDGLLDMATSYDTTNDITDETSFNEEKSIVRLIQNEQENNENQSLQYLRNRLNDYLEDIDDVPGPPDDIRPEYRNQSSGYLKFRQLNQGIIIRNTNSEYIEGLDPETQDYLSTGFTITMWVRFLDKKSEGTLFNFGNPTREENPMGFKLETLIDNEQRYLRLVVYDGFGTDGTNPYGDGTPYWYDSHFGNYIAPDLLSLPKIETDSLDDLENVDARQYLSVPMDFGEWYFICATYNPLVDEQASFDVSGFSQNPDFWRNNILGDGTNTYSSGLGSRSKVEIISRTQLLTARGYKV